MGAVTMRLSQLRPDLPQIRKERTAERGPKILDTGRASGAGFRSNRPLDHLYVSVAPFLDALVQVHEPLAQLGVLRIAPIDVHQQPLDLVGGIDGQSDVAVQLGVRHAVALARQIAQKRVPEGWFLKTTLQGLSSPTA